MKMSATTDERIASLNKEATAAKRAGDLGKAVRLLREAKKLEGRRYANTRLAKFLQESGDFKGAMAEIEALIDGSMAWAEAMFGHQPRSVRRRQQAGWISRIHKDAALICKRAKDSARQAHHEQERERWLAMLDKLDAVVEKDQADYRQAWEDAKKRGRAAMEEFLERKSRNQTG